METVKSAVEAYAEGRVHLPEVHPQARGVRDAPSFVPAGSPRRKDYPYTAETLGKYLGWEHRGGESPIPVALSALEMIEAGVLDEEDLKGLPRRNWGVGIRIP